MKRTSLPCALTIVILFWLTGCSTFVQSAIFPTSEKNEQSLPATLTPESPYREINQLEAGKIIHLGTGLEVSETDLIGHLSSTRIIYVGEVHDSIEDHLVQLKILKGLHKRFPGKIVIGMEMFRRSSQTLLDDWVVGKLEEKAFLKRWYEDWSHNDAYYQDLLQFISSEHIPVVALRPSAEMEFKVRDKGVSGLAGNDQRKLPEMDQNDAYHREAVQSIFRGHGPGSNQFDSFYKMMLFWEETMAESIANYLSSPEGSDKKMIVFAGGFHVGYGFGIPRRTFRRLPVPYQVVIPFSKDFPEEMKMKNVTPPSLPLPLSDFVWGVGYQELSEKKVRLGVMIEQFQAGVRVSDVFPDSPAGLAGIERGDIITSFDGLAITERFDLIYAVQQKAPADKVSIKLIRNGKVIEAEVVMAVSGHP